MLKATHTGSERRPARSRAKWNRNVLLCETAWEVCQQVGGIYTVVRSKVPYMVQQWGDNYCMVGPYNRDTAQVEFEEVEATGPFGAAVEVLRQKGLDVRFGRWLVTGRPFVVLLNPDCAVARLGEIKYLIWEHHGISINKPDSLLDRVLAFGWLVEQFVYALQAALPQEQHLIMHFHEWMAGTAIPGLRRNKSRAGCVFTTHATLLGRFLAMSDSHYYEHIPQTDWRTAAQRVGIEPQFMLERAAAHGAHVFSTVSEITGYECEHLVGRKPDVLVPNGLNIEHFSALHEFQNLHRMYKEKLHEFVTGHFFPSYSFDLDRTVYYFTSGRYEYVNKGFDLTIEAMSRLNWRMKQLKTDRTVVVFLITKADTRSINAEVLQCRAVLDEIWHTCEAIQNQIGKRLFGAVTAGKWPSIDSLVDDYWKLRLRRNLQAWKRNHLPLIITHDLNHENDDAILNQLRACRLFNNQDDPVKVVYHPDFVVPADPLFGMDYDQFVRGCHLGIFPSLYEPWGYAPMECVVMGIPTVTSDLAGFGTYCKHHIPDHNERGIMVLNRRGIDFNRAADSLADMALRFAMQERRDRIMQRNRVENTSDEFDWQNLGRHYDAAHQLALERSRGGHAGAPAHAPKAP